MFHQNDLFQNEGEGAFKWKPKTDKTTNITFYNILRERKGEMNAPSAALEFYDLIIFMRGPEALRKKIIALLRGP